MLTFHSGMALLNLLCSLLITGHDDGITLVGFVYLNSSYDFVEEDEDNDDPD